MKNFTWVRPKTLAEASATLKQNGAALSGGVELLCLLKEHLLEPDHVVDLKSVSGMREVDGSNGLKIGALATMDSIANSASIRMNFRCVAEAAESVGSPQIRNVGTLGGNLCQRPRCWYFRDYYVKCLKKGGMACYAVAGDNEYHAILGGGPCHIVHPSDLAPALIACDADVLTSERRMKLSEFFHLPDSDVRTENVLNPGELVTGVEAPATMKGWKSAYFKAKERPSFDWALSSCAVNLKVSGTTVSDCRIVLGGVAPIPWRSQEAEDFLKGKPITSEIALRAGEAAVANARPMTNNAFKVKLTANVVRIAILQAMGMPAE